LALKINEIHVNRRKQFYLERHLGGALSITCRLSKEKENSKSQLCRKEIGFSPLGKETGETAVVNLTSFKRPITANPFSASINHLLNEAIESQIQKKYDKQTKQFYSPGFNPIKSSCFLIISTKIMEKSVNVDHIGPSCHLHLVIISR
jgi:hypothetical protein